jgi:predicted DNA-binding transcriptional regulator YafY
MGAPLEYSAPHNGYYYSSDAFTLPQLFIGVEEKMALVYLAEQYSTMKNTQAGRLADLFSKLTEVQPKIGKVPEEIPIYDVSPNVVHTYNHLKQAIQSHTAVEIMYINPGETGTARVVSPYKLFTKNNKSYVVGFCELRKGLRVFRLDRIAGLVFTANPYTLSADYHEEDYGEDTNFNYINAYSCTIVSVNHIHFGKMKSTMDPAEKFRYTVEFFNSEELIQLLLSQPQPFTIEFPRWLREKLRIRLNRLLELNPS